MASEKNYASVSDLENLLLVTVDSSFTSQVDKWISAAEDYVNIYTGFTTASGFWNEQVTGEMVDARVDGDLNLIIYPRKRPVRSVSKIELWKGSANMALTLTNTSNGNTKYIIPTPGNAIVYPNYELMLTGPYIYIRNFANLKYSRWYTKIDYIGGYTSIPPDVTLATTMITADAFMRHANREGLEMLVQGRITKKWSQRFTVGKSDLITDAENILQSYRINSGWF